MNILSMIGGLGWQAKALLIVGVFILGFGSGWQTHGWKTDAAQGKGLAKQINQATGLQNEAKPIIEKKIEGLQQTKVVYRTIRERVYEKNDTGICFDAESLSLWNDAIAGADSHRAEPTGESAGNEAIIASVEEVLINGAENFETCNENIIKHRALINRVKSLEGKMCVCSK